LDLVSYSASVAASLDPALAETAATNPAFADTAVTNPATHPGARAPELEPGALFSARYLIERKLGAGGMGTVYAARDTLTEQAVAIKLVAGRTTHVEQERLREELRATMMLTHRNITRTYTLDEVDHEIFIVMELLEGETLAAKISRGPIPRADTLALITQLLDALAEAHSNGVIHRDVKPANIMCCPDRLVLMDFGLARVDDADTSTHTTSIKGTPAYMAPEVIAGRRADARADLYAVGLILFEMLTGRPPFKAATVNELLHRQLHDPIDTRSLDATLAAAITRATAKDPAERYASVDELRAGLTTPPPAPRKRRWIPAALVGALIVGGLGGWLAIRSFGDDAAATTTGPDVTSASASNTTSNPTASSPGTTANAIGSTGSNADGSGSNAFAPKPTPATAREAELDRMLTREISASLTKLGERACACKDLVCARRVVDDMVALGKRTRHFEVNVDEVPIRASKMFLCLTDLGLPPAELFDVNRRIRDQPKEPPRDSAW
jgi:serine/threonine protein kinase